MQESASTPKSGSRGRRRPIAMRTQRPGDGRVPLSAREAARSPRLTVPFETLRRAERSGGVPAGRWPRGPAREPHRGTPVPIRGLTIRETSMDRDRTEGSAKTMMGRIKGFFGRMTGDSKMQAEGKMDQAEGKIQNTVGGIKDSLRE